MASEALKEEAVVPAQALLRCFCATFMDDWKVVCLKGDAFGSIGERSKVLTLRQPSEYDNDLSDDFYIAISKLSHRASSRILWTINVAGICSPGGKWAIDQT